MGSPIPPGASGLPSGFTVAAPAHKSEALAFLLSFLIPGAGTYYGGKRLRGTWIAAVTLAALTGMWGMEEASYAGPFVWIVFRLTLIFIGFAVWDALATAQGVNTGSAKTERYNPRVAALLNLLTNGAGYFYIGETMLGVVGVALFLLIAISFVKSKPQQYPAVVLLHEGLAIWFSYDVYRRTRRKNPAAPTLRRGPSGSSTVWSTLTGAYAVLLAVVYASMLGFIVYVADFHVNQDGARFEATDKETVYENPGEGVKVRLPGMWQRQEATGGTFVRVKSSDESWDLSLAASPYIPIYTAEMESQEIERQFGKIGLSKISELKWTANGTPWKRIGLCRLRAEPRTILMGFVRIFQYCREGPYATLWIWQKRKQIYVMTLLSKVTDDPDDESNREGFSQFLLAAVTVD